MAERRSNVFVVLLGCLVGLGAAALVGGVTALRGRRPAIESNRLTASAGMQPARRITTLAAPKLTADESGRKVPVDPKSPSYDAGKLFDVGMDADQIFAREPRDPVWAPAREERVKDTIERDFAAVLPQAKVASVECHSMSCRLTIVAKDKEELTQTRRLLGYVPVAPTVVYHGNQKHADGVATELLLLFDQETATHDQYQHWYATSREVYLDELRRREAPRPKDYPAIPPG